MKNQFLFATAILFALSSFQCGKAGDASDGLNKETSLRTVLPATRQGKWELREVRGDMPLKHFEPGNGNILTFTGSKYEIYRNNTLDKSGVYAIEPDASVEQSICLTNLKDIYKHRIVFDNERSFREVVNRGADSLKPPTVVLEEYGKTFIGFSKNNDTLMLATGCFVTDGGSISKYVSIR